MYVLHEDSLHVLFNLSPSECNIYIYIYIYIYVYTSTKDKSDTFQQNKSECTIHQKQFNYKSTKYNIILITINKTNVNAIHVNKDKSNT